MRILFVAMADSVHAARWINQVVDQGWDIHLFAIDDAGIHPDLRNVTVHNYLGRKSSNASSSVRLTGSWPFRYGLGLAKHIAYRASPAWREQMLARTIRRLKPDIIHSLEIQHASYLTLAARARIRGSFPSWMVANWGSDIFLFGRLREHLQQIRAVLGSCDYYGCECHRDVDLARKFGFDGQVLPVIPNSGGFDITRMRALRSEGPTSGRRLIALKGYQGWSGRALVALRAIHLSADALQGYRVAVFSASEDVRIAAELVSHATGLPIEIIGPSPHDEIVRLHGKARMSIGLNISDAASTSMLEALIMGSFPIQSSTSCVDEWVQHGHNGFIVPPEDPEPVAAAIRRAAMDDDLVNRAAEINAEIADRRLEHSVIKRQAVAMYERVFAQKRAHTH